MNIAFCLYKFFPYGGLERDFLRIASLCLTRGHRVTVYTIVWEGQKPDGMDIHIIPVKHWSNHIRNQQYIQKVQPLLKTGEFDVVVGFNKMPGLDIYYAADPCYREKVKASRPWFYRLTSRYRHFSAYEKAVFGSESHTELMMISAIEKEYFKKHYGTQEARFHMLPPGISRDRIAPSNAKQIRKEWREEFGVNEDQRVILMVGSAFRRKGLDRALIGLASLPEPLKTKTCIMMIGEDDPQPFQRLAKKLGVASQLYFFLGRDDVPRFLQGADLFVHPAYSENTGTVILEAMVAGLPVLVSGACGYAFHVRDSGGGCVVEEPFQQEEYNQLLCSMLQNVGGDWANRALTYGHTHDLYSMPEAAADLIEATAKKKKKVGV